VSITQSVPAGWYPDQSGRQRWWDGMQWTEHYAPAVQPAAQPTHHQGPMTHGALNVNREVSYVRQQKGHSLTLHLLLGIMVLWVNVIYISVSPNHYWHA
jgi:hypothetical protein